MGDPPMHLEKDPACDTFKPQVSSRALHKIGPASWRTGGCRSLGGVLDTQRAADSRVKRCRLSPVDGCDHSWEEGRGFRRKQTPANFESEHRLRDS